MAIAQNKVIQVLFLCLGAILYSLFVFSQSELSLGNDSGQYYSYAVNLAETGVHGLRAGIPDAHREPAYPFFLGMSVFLGNFLNWNEPAQRAGLFVVWQSLLCFASSVAVLWMKTFSFRGKVSFFLALILSPTAITMNGMIYSETLAYSAAVLALVVFAKGLADFNWWHGVSLFLLGGILVSTKAHYQYLFVFILPISTLIWILAGRWGQAILAKRVAVLLITLAAGALLANVAWESRNRILFGGAGNSYRKVLMTLGKAIRSDRTDWSRDAWVGLTAALGSNFCGRVFPEDRCLRFYFRTSDIYAEEFIRAALSSGATEKAIEERARNEILAYWWESPEKQLAGSALEAFRISFMEFTDIGRGSASAIVKIFPSIWHFTGSLMLIVLFIFGLVKARLRRPELKAMVVFCLVMIAYHYAIYVNVTNVARFALVILPLVYFICASGLERPAIKGTY